MNGQTLVSGHCIKENSPNTFNSTATFGPYYVDTTGTSIGGVSINVQSRNNSPSGDWTSGTYNISCPAYVEPNIATVNVSISSITMTSMYVSWSTDRAAKQVNYTTNNGGNWAVGQSGINTTSGGFTISNLTHDSTYQVVIRCMLSNVWKLD